MQWLVFFYSVCAYCAVVLSQLVQSQCQKFTTVPGGRRGISPANLYHELTCPVLTILGTHSSKDVVGGEVYWEKIAIRANFSLGQRGFLPLFLRTLRCFSPVELNFRNLFLGCIFLSLTAIKKRQQAKRDTLLKCFTRLFVQFMTLIFRFFFSGSQALCKQKRREGEGSTFKIYQETEKLFIYRLHL